MMTLARQLGDGPGLGDQVFFQPSPSAENQFGSDVEAFLGTNQVVTTRSGTESIRMDRFRGGQEKCSSGGWWGTAGNRHQLRAADAARADWALLFTPAR